MFVCPKCNRKLNIIEKTYRCENGHCYDIAKKGYVNLLMSQVSKKRHHGDDKLMSVSRRDFLDKGYYKPLAKSLCELVQGKTVADIGCGECYYLSYIKDNIKKIVIDEGISGITKTNGNILFHKIFCSTSCHRRCKIRS